MANPNVPLGFLNRLRASIIVPAYPSLNVTASFLAPEGISLAPQGQVATNLPAMTGVVRSPEPYVVVRVTTHLIKSQALADAWKTQWELDSFIGDITVRPDANALSPFEIGNVSIISIEAMTFSGRDPGIVVTVEGSYNVNANYWG
jgi:hypothetical protein